MVALAWFSSIFMHDLLLSPLSRVIILHSKRSFFNTIATCSIFSRLSYWKADSEYSRKTRYSPCDWHYPSLDSSNRGQNAAIQGKPLQGEKSDHQGACIWRRTLLGLGSAQNDLHEATKSCPSRLIITRWSWRRRLWFLRCTSTR